MKSALIIILVLLPLAIGCSSRAGTAGDGEAAVRIRLHNPSELDRTEELVEVEWDAVMSRMSEPADPILVIDEESGEEVPHQVVPAAGVRPARLVMLVSLAAGASMDLRIETGAPAIDPQKRVSVIHMEQRDDIAWENDRIVYRTYGEGLWALEDLVSSGIDVFTKRTSDLVLERWYASGDYHTDHGEGADFFMVGPTLGGGGSALLVGGELARAPNFRRQEILADGPLVGEVRLEYGPWGHQSDSLREERIISIAAAQDFYRQDTRITPGGSDGRLAAGLVRRPEVAVESGESGGWTWLMHYGPLQEPGAGELGTAVIMRDAEAIDGVANHDVVVSGASADMPVTHYVGSCWSETGRCSGADEWRQLVEGFVARLAAPFDVSFID